MKKSVEQLFHEFVEELTQPFIAIAETVQAINTESRPDCDGSPCTCDVPVTGREDTLEEQYFFNTHTPWPHENTCGARDGGPCDCKPTKDAP